MFSGPWFETRRKVTVLDIGMLQFYLAQNVLFLGIWVAQNP
jgi:hypothetical protein